MLTTMTTTTTGPWLTAREARDHLGVSEITLARWRRSGLLRAGRDWRRKFPTPRSTVLYHLDHCEAVMNEATARSVALLEPLLPAASNLHTPGQNRRAGGGSASSLRSRQPRSRC